MAESPLDLEASPATVVGGPPRFFLELNEPILLFGLNPSGLGLPLMGAAVCAGMSFWGGALACVVGSLFLCRRMAKNPTILNEWIARSGRTRFVVPHATDGFDPIRILNPKGASGPGIWLTNFVRQGAAQPQPKKRARVGPYDADRARE